MLKTSKKTDGFTDPITGSHLAGIDRYLPLAIRKPRFTAKNEPVFATWANYLIFVIIILSLSFIPKVELVFNQLLMSLFQYSHICSFFCSFSSLNSRLQNSLYHCHANHVYLDQVKLFDFIRFLSPSPRR